MTLDYLLVWLGREQTRESGELNFELGFFDKRFLFSCAALAQIHSRIMEDLSLRVTAEA